MGNPVLYLELEVSLALLASSRISVLYLGLEASLVLLAHVSLYST